MLTQDHESKASKWLRSIVFDVDSRTGFMPPKVPLQRLPDDCEAWETLLAEAIRDRLSPGDKIGLSDAEKSLSARWRVSVQA
ncbi:hypothetical protein MPER_16159, partial [Moniliophthora perniciosa FA553]